MGPHNCRFFIFAAAVLLEAHFITAPHKEKSGVLSQSKGKSRSETLGSSKIRSRSETQGPSNAQSRKESPSSCETQKPNEKTASRSETRTPSARTLSQNEAENLIKSSLSKAPGLLNCPKTWPMKKMILRLYLPFLWKELETFNIKGGDVVVCQTSEFGVAPTEETHWFLAINSYELLHADDSFDYISSYAQIRADRRMAIRDGFVLINADRCKHLGDGGFKLAEVVERAMKWNRQKVFYDGESCSSYHWVTYWVTGKTPSERNKLSLGFKKPLHPRCRLKTIEADQKPLEIDWQSQLNVG